MSDHYPYARFVRANPGRYNPVPNFPVVNEAGTATIWTGPGLFIYRTDRTWDQVLHIDLPWVLGMMDGGGDIPEEDQQHIMDVVFRALPLEESNSDPLSLSEEEEDGANTEDADTNNAVNDDYVPLLRRSCIRDELNSSAETQEDKELSQLASYKHNFDM